MVARKTADNKKSPSGQLRIVAGKWRSRLLQIADVPGLRPTSSRVRETLFNWLTPRLNGARCLDLCAGTGALGIEALSRGASQVVFVEPSPLAATVLDANLRALNATGAEVLRADARRFLAQKPDVEFNIVFLDPPFAENLHVELCRLLNQSGWLADGTRIYIESDRRRIEPALPQNWRVLKSKYAGNVRYMLATPEHEGESRQ
jgi:16S rRNA (guanine966-N2)-methyltransferase